MTGGGKPHPDMPPTGQKTNTRERCRSLWERLYPNVKKPETYFSEWYKDSMAAGGLVLDAGCGAGGSADHTASGSFSVGLDTDLDALKRNRNVHFKVAGSIDAMPFKDGVFGTVTSQYAIEHLEKPLDCFREISRVSKPAGTFFFMTTNASGYNGILIRLIPNRLQFAIKIHILKMNEREIYPVYLRSNTRKRLKKYLQTAGFGAPELIFIGGPFYFAFSYMLFRIAVALEHLTDGRLKHLKFYIVGRATKR
jgi:SAM-dependent methyltransferase